MAQNHLPDWDQLTRKPVVPGLQGNEIPRAWRGLIGVRLFCREIDRDYSTPPDGFEPSTDCLEDNFRPSRSRIFEAMNDFLMPGVDWG